MNKEIEHIEGIGYEKTVAIQEEKVNSKLNYQSVEISPFVEMTK